MSACTLMSDGMLHVLVDFDFIVHSKKVDWYSLSIEILSGSFKVLDSWWEGHLHLPHNRVYGGTLCIVRKEHVTQNTSPPCFKHGQVLGHI